jgi:hypothetical protein
MDYIELREESTELTKTLTWKGLSVYCNTDLDGVKTIINNRNKLKKKRMKNL